MSMAERKDNAKPRRQLPAIPAATPEIPPRTPHSLAEIPLVPSYSASPRVTSFPIQNPPPLPARPQSFVGTSHATYVPDASFREPELVSEDRNVLSDQHVLNWTDQSTSQWATGEPFLTDSHSSWNQEEWPNTEPTWDAGYHTQDWGNAITMQGIDIDGRNEEEEFNWWDSSIRGKNNRPGPGFLPTQLETFLHDPDHSLYHVTATPPDFKSSHRHRSSTPASDILSQSAQPVQLPPPTPEEVRTAIPHPNAYYCRRHNGWVLLLWKSSSVEPPLAEPYLGAPLPDQARRRKTNTCIGEGAQPFAQMNKTHHFHLYKKAIDASKLNPPFLYNIWDSKTDTRQKRHQSIFLEGNSTSGTSLVGEEGESVEEEGQLLDLFLCCQCSFYCVASQIIPGIIPVKYFEDLTREKTQAPQVGKSPEVSVSIAWETILMIIENRLWKGETRSLPVYRPSFQTKLGWSNTSQTIFDHLGFHVEPIHGSQNELALQPPPTDPSTSEGARNRSKLLRAWVEIGAWLSDYHRRFLLVPREHSSHKVWIKTDSVREMYQTGIGAHPEQIPRNILSYAVTHAPELDESWIMLGLTAASYSWELLTFAYLAQCRCDPKRTVDYFSALVHIVEALQNLGEVVPNELQNLVMEERSRSRFTKVDFANSVRLLGFGPEGPLGVDFDDTVEDEFIINAWKDGTRRSWRDTVNGPSTRHDLNDAFRIIAEMRGSSRMRKVWEQEKGSIMTEETAYSTLGVSKDMDETTLITVFLMRLEDASGQADKLREALSVITEVMDSARLRAFLETGTDPGTMIVPTSPDMPRGLNQLGNTCYLNSLLQYFYTIKDLRDAVTALSNVDANNLDSDKSLDCDTDQRRVGGRLVTKREILRSRKFVEQLAGLFWNLEFCENPAVTPTIELAKLALVTSKDEEEEDGDKGGTDSSNDTDATLVEDTPSYFTAAPEEILQLPSRSSPSVLGKRSRENTGVMDVDSQESEKEKDYVMVSKPGSPHRDNTASHSAISADSPSKRQEDGDVVMQDVSKPFKSAVPSRKSSESVMMFGRQHDVAECMDSCLFQLECAELIRSSKLSGTTLSDSEKTSIVKRLFYGKIRQRVTPDCHSSRSSIHEKEDLFSHLPVNVSEEGFDIYDGLSRYFDDTVEFQGNKAHMEVTLVDLPPLLQIQLQRVQFNRDQLQAFKSQAYIKFWETIAMDRFMDDADIHKKAHSKAIQAQLNLCRERIRQLTETKHAPFELALQETQQFLTNQAALDFPEVDEEMLIQLNNEGEVVKTELEAQRMVVARLKESLEDLWKSDQEALYELTSVFIHRGDSPSWGHYFFYSRHLPDHPDSWFKYNDSDVSVVSKEEVLADTTGSNANPYLLVFARKGSEVIQTVKRFDVSSLEEAASS